MTRIRFVVAAAFAVQVALAGLAAPAAALGVGVYGSAGGGGASWDDAGDWNGSGWDGGDGWDRNTRHTGFGFALETPTGIFPLSYRLGLGWEHIVFEGERGLPDRDLDGLVIDQDLTYDLVASPVTRFWVGPELRLAFLQSSSGGTFDEDRNFVAAGFGPVFGFDIALNPGVALSWKLGFLATGYSTDEDTWSDGSRDRRVDDSISEGHGYVSLTLYFRLGGGYYPQPPPPQYQPQRRW